MNNPGTKKAESGRLSFRCTSAHLDVIFISPETNMRIIHYPHLLTTTHEFFSYRYLATPSNGLSVQVLYPIEELIPSRICPSQRGDEVCAWMQKYLNQDSPACTDAHLGVRGTIDSFNPVKAQRCAGVCRKTQVVAIGHVIKHGTVALIANRYSQPARVVKPETSCFTGFNEKAEAGLNPQELLSWQCVSPFTTRPYMAYNDFCGGHVPDSFWLLGFLVQPTDRHDFKVDRQMGKIMDYFRVANWNTLQHYKDRNPPWIKLHNSLLDDYEFSRLTDQQRFHLLAIMMLASRTENNLPDDPDWLKSKIGASTKVNILPLIDAGFIEYNDSNQEVTSDDAASTPLVEQDASKVLDQRQSRAERETEHTEFFNEFWKSYPGPRAKTNRKESLKKWLTIDPSLYQQIIDHVQSRRKSDPEWLKEDGRFILGPAPFLNQQRWEDEWTPQSSGIPAHKEYDPEQGLSVIEARSVEQSKRKLNVSK